MHPDLKKVIKDTFQTHTVVPPSTMDSAQLTTAAEAAWKILGLRQ